MAEVLIGIHSGTNAEYEAERAAGRIIATDLYFTTDIPRRLYRGTNLATEPYALVSKTPEIPDMLSGTLYINKFTGAINVLDGNERVTILPDRVTTIQDNTPSSAIPTVGAIKDFVGEAASGSFIDVSYISEEGHFHQLKFIMANQDVKYLELPGGLADVQYDPNTGTFTFTKYDGTTVKYDTPLEKIMTGSRYDETTHILTMTFNIAGEDTDVTVDLHGLVDTFTVAHAENGPIGVTSKDGVFTIDLSLDGDTLTKSSSGLKVAISQEEGNQLTVKADGLYVAVPSLTGYVKKEDLAAETGASMVGVSKTFSTLDKTVEGVLTDHEQRIGVAEDAIDEIDERIDAAEQRISDLESKMTDAEGDITALQNTTQMLKSALTWKPIASSTATS